MQNHNCCYVGTVNEFLAQKENLEDWIATMKAQFHVVYPNFELHDLEVASWADTFDVLQDALPMVDDKNATYVVFEYKLPEQGGRRPDVLLINGKQICVLEFKKKSNYDDLNLDQVISYGRDLKEYHEQSRNMNIKLYLILTESHGLNKQKRGDVLVCSPDKLSFTLDQVGTIDIQKWLESKYEPLPTMVESALKLRDKAQKDYPDIFQVRNTKIPKVEDLLNTWLKYAKENKKIVFACLTGAPGTGKTLIGLNLIYNHLNEKPIYLTANKALIEVLQEEYGTDDYIRSILNYKTSSSFNHNIIVIDEGQRVWDTEKNSFNNRIYKNDLIQLINQNDWGFVLVIAAQGQVFNTKEHETLKGWANAIKDINAKEEKWEIIIPVFFAKDFENPFDVLFIDELELTDPLRSQRGCVLNQFVNTLLDGNFKEAQTLYKNMDASFPIYITHDLETAREYCKRRYDSDKRKHYGIITSSKGNAVECKQLYDNFNNWFLTKAGSNASSENFEACVTELGCQGLELDMPIVYWNNDLTWQFVPVTKTNYFAYIREIGNSQNIALETDWHFDNEIHFEHTDKLYVNKDFYEFTDECDIKEYLRLSESTLPETKDISEDEELLYKKNTENCLLDGFDLRTKYEIISPRLSVSVIKSHLFQELRGYYWGYPKPFFSKIEWEMMFSDYKINYYERCQYIRNVYRVLLTRGRDGMILYIPQGEEYGDTYKLLKTLGLQELRLDKM